MASLRRPSLGGTPSPADAPPQLGTPGVFRMACASPSPLMHGTPTSPPLLADRAGPAMTPPFSSAATYPQYARGAATTFALGGPTGTNGSGGGGGGGGGTTNIMAEMGPHMWATMHYAVHQCPDSQFATCAPALLSMIRSYEIFMPCADCKNHYAALLRLHPPEQAAALGRDALARWTVDAHNSVNARLGKPTMSYTEAEAIYGRTNLQCPERVRDDLQSTPLGDQVPATTSSLDQQQYQQQQQQQGDSRQSFAAPGASAGVSRAGAAAIGGVVALLLVGLLAFVAFGGMALFSRCPAGSPLARLAGSGSHPPRTPLFS